MTRPLTSVLAVLLLAAAIVFGGTACGGGGTGGSNGGSTGDTPRGNIYLPSLRIVGTASGSQTARSLDNLAVGEKVTVRALAIYVVTGRPAYGGAAYQDDVKDIALTADPSVATLSGSTLTVVGAGTGTISLTTNGQTISATVRASNGLGTISGRVRMVDDGTNQPGVATVPVRFANASGTVVVTGVTGPDGRFVAHVPAGTSTFFADLSGFSNSYYDLFEYDGKTYTYNSGANNCGVPLNGVTAATNATLDDAITTIKSLSSGPPPPPVSGCGG